MQSDLAVSPKTLPLQLLAYTTDRSRFLFHDNIKADLDYGKITIYERIVRYVTWSKKEELNWIHHSKKGV